MLQYARVAAAGGSVAASSVAPLCCAPRAAHASAAARALHSSGSHSSNGSGTSSANVRLRSPARGANAARNTDRTPGAGAASGKKPASKQRQAQAGAAATNAESVVSSPDVAARAQARADAVAQSEALLVQLYAGCSKEELRAALPRLHDGLWTKETVLRFLFICGREHDAQTGLALVQRLTGELGMTMAPAVYLRLIMLMLKNWQPEFAADVVDVRRRMSEATPRARFTANQLLIIAGEGPAAANVLPLEKWARDDGVWSPELQAALVAKTGTSQGSSTAHVADAGASASSGSAASTSNSEATRALPQLAARIVNAKKQQRASLLKKAEELWTPLFQTSTATPADVQAMVTVYDLTGETRRLLSILLDALRLELGSAEAPFGSVLPLPMLEAALQTVKQVHREDRQLPVELWQELYVRASDQPSLTEAGSSDLAHLQAVLVTLCKLIATSDLVVPNLRDLPLATISGSTALFAAGWTSLQRGVSAKQSNKRVSDRHAMQAEQLAARQIEAGVPLTVDHFTVWLSTFVCAGTNHLSELDRVWALCQEHSIVVTEELARVLLSAYLSMGVHHPPAVATAETLYATLRLPTLPDEMWRLAILCGELGLTEQERTWRDLIAQLPGEKVPKPTPRNEAKIEALGELAAKSIDQPVAVTGEAEVSTAGDAASDAAAPVAVSVSPPFRGFLDWRRNRAGPGLPPVAEGQRVTVQPLRDGQPQPLNDYITPADNVGDLPAVTTQLLRFHQAYRLNKTEWERAERQQERLNALLRQDTEEQSQETGGEDGTAAPAPLRASAATVSADMPPVVSASPASEQSPLFSDMVLAASDFSNNLKQLRLVQRDGIDKFPLLHQREATILDRIFLSLSLRAQSPYTLYPSADEWGFLLTFCSHFQLYGRGLPLYKLMLQLETKKKQEIDKQPLIAGGATGDNSAVQTSAPEVPVRTPEPVAPAAPAPTTAESTDPAAVSTVGAPAEGQTVPPTATGAAEAAPDTQQSAAAPEALSVSEQPASEPDDAVAAARAHAAHLAELERRDPNPLPPMAAFTRSGVPRSPMQHVVLECIIGSLPGNRGAQESRRWLNYMMRAGYPVSARSLGMVLRAHTNLLPLRTRTGNTPLLRDTLAQLRRFHDDLIQLPVASGSQAEYAHMPVTLVMWQAYLRQRDFESVAQLEQHLLQGEKDCTNWLFLSLQMDTLEERRHDIALEQAEAAQVAHLSRAADVAIAARSGTLAAEHIHKDADVVWQRALSDPQRLMSARLVHSYLQLHSHANDIDRMFGVIDQVLAIEARMNAEAGAESTAESESKVDGESGVQTVVQDRSARVKHPPVLLDNTACATLFYTMGEDVKPHRWLPLACELQKTLQQRFDQALMRGDAMATSILMPSDTLLQSFVRFLQRAGQTTQVASLVHELPATLKEGNPILFVAALNALARDAAKAESMAQHMTGHGVALNKQSATALLSSTRDSGDWGKAEEHWHNMLTLGLPLDGMAYRTLIETLLMAAGLGDRTQLRKIDALLDEMRQGANTQGRTLEFNVRDYSMLLQTSKEARQAEQAQRFALMAQQAGLFEQLPSEARAVVATMSKWQNTPMSKITSMERRQIRIQEDMREFGHVVPLTVQQEAAAKVVAEEQASAPLLLSQATVRRLESEAKEAAMRERERVMASNDGAVLSREQVLRINQQARERVFGKAEQKAELRERRKKYLSRRATDHTAQRIAAEMRARTRHLISAYDMQRKPVVAPSLEAQLAARQAHAEQLEQAKQRASTLRMSTRAKRPAVQQPVNRSAEYLDQQRERREAFERLLAQREALYNSPEEVAKRQRLAEKRQAQLEARERYHAELMEQRKREDIERLAERERRAAAKAAADAAEAAGPSWSERLFGAVESVRNFTTSKVQAVRYAIRRLLPHEVGSRPSPLAKPVPKTKKMSPAQQLIHDQQMRAQQHNQALAMQQRQTEQERLAALEQEKHVRSLASPKVPHARAQPTPAPASAPAHTVRAHAKPATPAPAVPAPVKVEVAPAVSDISALRRSIQKQLQSQRQAATIKKAPQRARAKARR